MKEKVDGIVAVRGQRSEWAHWLDHRKETVAETATGHSFSKYHLVTSQSSSLNGHFIRYLARAR